MACGSIVVSYGNEGSDEIIKNDVNGYCVEPGDIKKVAEIIKALEASSARVQEISTTARSEIIETHTITAYIDKIETFIKQTFWKLRDYRVAIPWFYWRNPDLPKMS